MHAFDDKNKIFGVKDALFRGYPWAHVSVILEIRQSIVEYYYYFQSSPQWKVQWMAVHWKV